MAVIDLSVRTEGVIEEDLAEAPESAGAAVLEETYFLAPTRFAVGGVELLSVPGAYEAWRPLPLLGFAPGLRRATSELRDRALAVVSLADGGELTLRRDGEEVTISSSLTDDEVQVTLEELVEASDAFAGEVCDLLLSRVPAMAKHQSWATWCYSADPATSSS